MFRDSPTSDIRDRAIAARARFASEGVNISEWARERGFSGKLTSEILRGHRPCLRGESFRIAVALGIRQRPGTVPMGEVRT